MPDPVELQPADIFLSRSSTLLGCLIRFFTRAFGESRTKVNHVGVVVEGGNAEEAVVIEALASVRRHRLWSRYGKKRKFKVAVYRPRELPREDAANVVAAAVKYEGQAYGKLMIAAHFLDWLLLGAYVFRRLVAPERYPICSWLVAWSFEKAGLTFGVPLAVTSPDDIWDYVRRHPDEYEELLPLEPLA